MSRKIAEMLLAISLVILGVAVGLSLVFGDATGVERACTSARIDVGFDTLACALTPPLVYGLWLGLALLAGLAVALAVRSQLRTPRIRLLVGAITAIAVGSLSYARLAGPGLTIDILRAMRTSFVQRNSLNGFEDFLTLPARFVYRFLPNAITAGSVAESRRRYDVETRPEAPVTQWGLAHQSAGGVVAQLFCDSSHEVLVLRAGQVAVLNKTGEKPEFTTDAEHDYRFFAGMPSFERTLKSGNEKFESGCRKIPQNYFFCFTSERAIYLSGPEGSRMYQSFDYRNAPSGDASLLIKGETKRSTFPATHEEEYEFRNEGYVYNVRYSNTEANISVYKGDTLIQKEGCLGYGAE